MASIAVNIDQSAAANANIKALEGLLDEFFRDVSNARKAEIERMLTEFGEQVIFSQLSFYVKGEFSGKASIYTEVMPGFDQFQSDYLADTHQALTATRASYHLSL